MSKTKPTVKSKYHERHKTRSRRVSRAPMAQEPGEAPEPMGMDTPEEEAQEGGMGGGMAGGMP